MSSVALDNQLDLAEARPVDARISEFSDEVLAERARARDAVAFAELYRRYHRLFGAYCRRRVGEDTPDVLQSVFLAVFRGLASYRGPRFLPWAYRICANRVTDALRSTQRQPQREQLDVDSPSGGTTPEDEFIAKRAATGIHASLMRLPLEQRNVFCMSRIDGLSHAEIADLLGVPVGTVKSRMHKAVRALFTDLEET